MRQASNRRVLTLTLLSIPHVLGARADAVGGLEKLLDFARTEIQGDRRGGRSPLEATGHPFAARSVLVRMGAAVVPGGTTAAQALETIREVIADVEAVMPLLARPRLTPADLPRLIDVYRLALFTRAEPAVLERIVAAMVLARRPLAELGILLDLAHARAPLFVLHSRLLPDFDVAALRLEELVARARHRVDGPERLTAEVRQALGAHPFDAGVLYNAACVMALAGRPDAARTLLLRATLLDAGVPERLAQDPDLAAINRDARFVEGIRRGTLRRPIKGSPHPGIDRVEVTYQWSGLGKSVKEERNLVWTKDRFVEAVGRREVPGTALEGLIARLKRGRPVTRAVNHITHSDDYPLLSIRLVRAGQPPVLLYSGSNAAWMLPINAYVDGGLRYTTDRIVGHQVAHLLAWLGVKRGSPMGSYGFGGSEMPVRGLGGTSSRFESRFYEDAGIPVPGEGNSPRPETPAEVQGLDGLSLEEHLVTERPGPRPEDTMVIDRFTMVGRTSDAGGNREVVLQRHSQPGDVSWLYGSPSAHLSLVRAVEALAASLLGGRLEQVMTAPFYHSGVGPYGTLGMRDVHRLIRILEPVRGDLVWLGTAVVPLTVRASRGKAGNLRGLYFPGEGVLVVEELDLWLGGSTPGPAGSLLDWCGLEGPGRSIVERVSLAMNGVRLQFRSPTTPQALQAVVKGAVAAGRKPGRVEGTLLLVESSKGSMGLVAKGGATPTLEVR